MESKRMGVSRRSFLGAVGGSLAGSALGSGPRKPMILGAGDHKYECIHDWIEAPPGHKFGDTHGLAQDSKGRIYVAHTVHEKSIIKDAVCVYDSNGKFLTSWGEGFASGAHGLDIRKEGKQEYLYHCDTRRRLVVKTNLDGTIVWSRGIPLESGKYTSDAPYVPTNVAFGEGEALYVADGYGSCYIHVYDADGGYKKTFGERGNRVGELSCPHGLFVDRRGKEPLLAIADRGNRRIQYFDLDGKPHHIDKEGMRMPCHFDTRGGDMLVPDLESVITILDEHNKLVVHLGDGHPTNLRGKPESEFVAGKFIHPHDAIFLKNGDILVAEWVPEGRVTLLKRVK